MTAPEAPVAAAAEPDRRHVWLTMRDGVRLSAYVWVPVHTASGVPTVVMSNPYSKEIYFGPGKLPYIRRFNDAGYAVAIVDFRGTGASEGSKPDAFSPDERDDVTDSILELARCAWSNGELAAWGMSYGGISALHAATSGLPALKAAVAIEGSTDPYDYEVMRKGVPGLAMIVGEWSSMMLALANVPPAPAELDRPAYLERLAHTQPWHHIWARHPGRDAYWDGRGHDPAEINVPTLFITGWRGTQLPAAWRDFASAGAEAKIICGPWPHATPDEQKIHGVDSVGLAIDWFDEHLGRRQPADRQLPRISCFVMGADEWEAPDDTSGTGRVVLSLTRDMRLSGAEPDAVIASDDSVTVDYSATVGVSSGIGMSAANASGLSADAGRSRIWTSAPVPAPLEIYGTPALCLTVGVHPAGTDVAAKLIDLAPDGTAALITRGLLRCGDGKPAAPADAPVRETVLAVDLDPIRYRVASGHCLMLALATSDFPEYWPNPSGHGYRVRTGRHASALTLPTLSVRPPRTPDGALPPPPADLATRLRSVAERADDGYAVEFDGDRVSISGGSVYRGTTLRAEPVSFTHRLTIVGCGSAPERAALTTRTAITVGAGEASRSAHAECTVTADAMHARLRVTAADLDLEREFTCHATVRADIAH